MIGTCIPTIKAGRRSNIPPNPGNEGHNHKIEGTRGLDLLDSRSMSYGNEGR
ncbi:hypothetical protein KFK09_019000 [Dendrobium nobile]|uniref:Uncharacterized protein n=1 Tax=Dendrobium nobile TaxID=94219 RepID=A0A8T3AWB3_DENNO|nr:hypothetical protein KFK09_019000 [Dendrobium nobile]